MARVVDVGGRPCRNHERDWQNELAAYGPATFYVRFGSKADIASRLPHVCFTPESGHESDIAPCPPSANMRHCPIMIGAI